MFLTFNVSVLDIEKVRIQERIHQVWIMGYGNSWG